MEKKHKNIHYRENNDNNKNHENKNTQGKDSSNKKKYINHT